MRWSEITERLNQDGQIKRYALDLLIPLAKEGVDRVTVKQLKDKLNMNPEVAQGIDIGDDYLGELLKDLDIIDRIEIDPETDVLTIFFTPPNEGEDNRHVKQAKADQEKAKMDKTATKQAKKQMDGGEFDL